MKRMIIFIWGVCLSVSVMAMPIRWLQNNVPVYYTQASDLPIVDIGVVFDAGSARDGLLPGIAFLAGEMFDKDHQGVSEEKLKDSMNQYGVQFSADVGRDATILSFRFPSKYAAQVVPLISQVLSPVDIKEETLARVKAQSQTAMKIRDEDPMEVATMQLMAALYDHHPYAHPVWGNAKSLKRIRKADLEVFFKDYLTKQQAAFVLVGDVTKKQAKQWVMQWAALLPQGQALPPLPKVPMRTSSQEIKVPMSTQQVTMLQGRFAINYNDPRRYALAIINRILGVGMDSVLFREVRDQEGFSYDVGSQFYPLLLKGPWWVRMQSRSAIASLARKKVQAVLGRFLEKDVNEKHSRLLSRVLKGGSCCTVLRIKGCSLRWCVRRSISVRLTMLSNICFI